MKIATFLVAITAAFSTGILAAVLPTRDADSELLGYLQPLQTTDNISETVQDAPASQFQHAMGSLSYLFGWTMAGSALSDDELDPTCQDISNTGHGKWFAAGLIPANIQGPICNASHSNPSANTANVWVVNYSTELFVTYVLNAFAANNTAAFSYLCDNLRFIAIDDFHMNDEKIVSAACTAGGKPLPPRPEGALPGAQAPANATQAFANTASVLYALMFAASAESNSQLNIYCAHAPEYVVALDGMVSFPFAGVRRSVVIGDPSKLRQPLSLTDITDCDRA